MYYRKFTRIFFSMSPYCQAFSAKPNQAPVILKCAPFFLFYKGEWHVFFLLVAE